jgi:hypothetical protein
MGACRVKWLKRMLDHVNYWMDIGGTVVDGLLLLRILQLRLHRIYFFISLAAFLSLFFDGVMIWLGPRSHEFVLVFIYSRFLYAFVFPAAAYDVWEESKSQVANIRRPAAFRLVSSLLIASVLGLVITGFAASDDAGEGVVLGTFAVILWAASTTASLAFLWSVHRLARAKKVELPSNTAVWLLYYQLSLAGEVVACLLLIVDQQFSAFAGAVLDLSLGIYEIAITLWCIWHLRALSSDVPSAHEGATP